LMNAEQLNQRVHHVAVRTLLILVLSAFASGALAEPETRIYQLNNRTAEDRSQQIRALYQQAPVTFTSRARQLVVRGAPSLLDETGTAANCMDEPPIQLRIRVRYRRELGRSQSGGGVTGSLARANVNVEALALTTNASAAGGLVAQDDPAAQNTP